MITLIFESLEDFENREDKSVNGVSLKVAGSNPNFEEENSTNEGCWNSVNCRHCVECKECVDCSFCEECIESQGCVHSENLLKGIGDYHTY